MRVARLALGSAFLFVSTIALAQPPAPAVGPTGSGDFYPLKPGTKWTYKVADTTIVVQVAGTDSEGTKLETKVADKVVASEVLKVSPDKISRVKINSAAITPPVDILRFEGGKVVKGAKWKIESKIQDATVKGEFTVKDDKEKIEVGAGKFEAVCVEGPEFDIAGTKTAVRYWFVAGKGIVKLSYSIQGNEAVLELKEYTEGK